MTPILIPAHFSFACDLNNRSNENPVLHLVQPLLAHAVPVLSLSCQRQSRSRLPTAFEVAVVETLRPLTKPRRIITTLCSTAYSRLIYPRLSPVDSVPPELRRTQKDPCVHKSLGHNSKRIFSHYIYSGATAHFGWKKRVYQRFSFHKYNSSGNLEYQNP